MPNTPDDEGKVLVPASFYSNASHLIYGVFDFRILFGDQGQSASGELVMRRMVEIVMSPQHLKQFSSVMVEKVAEYEQKYGPIPFDPSAVTEEENAPPVSSE